MCVFTVMFSSLYKTNARTPPPPPHLQALHHYPRSACPCPCPCLCLENVECDRQPARQVGGTTRNVLNKHKRKNYFSARLSTVLYLLLYPIYIPTKKQKNATKCNRASKGNRRQPNLLTDAYFLLCLTMPIHVLANNLISTRDKLTNHFFRFSLQAHHITLLFTLAHI